MTDSEQCPYGAKMCPKIEEYERRITRLENNQAKIMMTLYILVGITTATLGVSII